MNPSPFVRTSFWTVTIGLTSLWISNLGVSQTCIQRFLAVPDIRFARKSVWVFVVGLIFIKGASCLVGIIMYTYYEKCDPVVTKQIQKIDQILPFFIMEVASQIPGLPGIFIAGIFSAALSSLSSGLNTLAGTIYEDFISPFMPNATEKRASDIMKMIVLILGLIMVLLVFVVEHMGQVFVVSVATSGVTAGSLLGIFTIGMLSRYVNTKGVIWGAIIAFLALLTIIIGAQSQPKHTPLPTRTDGCDFPFNNSITLSTDISSLDDGSIIFKLSFMYYCIVGSVILSLVAYVVSWLTGGCEPFDERLLAPFMRNNRNRVKDVDDVRKQKEKTVEDETETELDHALREMKRVTMSTPRVSVDSEFLFQ